MGSLWNRSGTFERTGDDVPAAGAKAYFYIGGTTTPLVVYEDAAEGSAYTHPLTADAYGRWPDVFVPYVVSFDVRLTTAEGVQLTYTLEIPNPDPIDLSVTIPAENQVQTGMIHAELFAGTRAGYVRLNNRTIGNASSGATERANADTEDLFIYLWNALSDTFATVSGGRGASAAADYAANKTIVLPGCRGNTFMGLDDMGNSAVGSFVGLTFTSGDSTTPGSTIGTNSITLDLTNIPAHTHTGTTSTDGGHSHTGSGTTSSDGAHTHTGSGTTSSDGATTPTTSSDGSHTHTGTTDSGGVDHTHTYNQPSPTASAAVGGLNYTVAPSGTTTGGASAYLHTHTFTTAANGGHTHTVSIGNHSHTYSFTTSSNGAHTHTYSFTTSSVASHSHTFTTSSVGSGAVFNNLPRARLVTWFIKL